MKKTKLALFLAIMFLSSLLISYSPLIAFASESTEKYTSVIADLQKDENFDADDFEFIQNDYSLQVIQIAESNRKEVFIYVYQPGAIAYASSINISLNLHDELSFNNFSLQLLSAVGLFQKYLVQDLIVIPENIRYYEISSIFRIWNEKVDEVPEGNNTVSEIAYEVGKLFTFINDEEGYHSFVTDIEVIEITEKYVGFVRYFGGNSYFFIQDSHDSHFVAFSTNKKIEKLLEADVYFKIQQAYYESSPAQSGWEFGAVYENYSYMTSNDAAFYRSPSTAWQDYSYSWSRIQSADEFIQGEDFSKVHRGKLFNQRVDYVFNQEDKENIANKDWVLRFYESWYQSSNFPYKFESSTIVSDVSILRLKFESDGAVYNLGVVDNKQTGDGVPDNSYITTITASTLLKIIIALVALLIISIILGSLKTIIEILLLPFSIFKKRNKEGK